jgi:hypothetical protein
MIETRSGLRVRPACDFEIDIMVRPGDDFAPIAAIGSVLRLSPQVSAVDLLQGLRLPQDPIATARHAMHDACGALVSATVSREEGDKEPGDVASTVQHLANTSGRSERRQQLSR